MWRLLSFDCLFLGNIYFKLSRNNSKIDNRFIIIKNIKIKISLINMFKLLSNSNAFNHCKNNLNGSKLVKGSNDVMGK